MIENPYEILKQVKNELKMVVENWEYLKNVDDEKYEKARLIISKICKEDNIEVPRVIKTCLEIEEFFNFIYDGNTNNNEVLLFIQDTFNPFIDIVRERSITVEFIAIEFKPPSNLTYSHIKMS